MEIKIENVGWGQVMMDLECHRKESELEGLTVGGLNKMWHAQHHASGRVTCQGR